MTLSVHLAPIVICIGYLAGAWACLRSIFVVFAGRTASRNAFRDRRKGDRTRAYIARAVFWALMSAIFVFLAVNRQFGIDLQLAAVGRDVAIEQGWYHDRQAFQVPALIVLGILCLAGLVTAVVFTRELLPRQKVAFAGAAVLAMYVAAAASSFHYVDSLFRSSPLGARTGWLIEGAGIALVVGCAWANAAWIRKRA